MIVFCLGVGGKGDFYGWDGGVVRRSRGDHFRFGLVFIKKNNQTGFFFKKWNRFKPTGFGSVILEQKPIQTGLARFFQFGSVFSIWLGFFPVWLSFFPVWLGFFQFGFGSIRFFRFQVYKTETEPVSFFKILIVFFHDSVFSVIFFPVFLFFRFFCSPLRRRW